MAVRTTMSSLIAEVRELVNDGGTATFSDQRCQDVLDQHRDDIYYLLLSEVPTISPGGSVTYLDYYADRGHWEADEVLKDGSFTTQGTALYTADRLVGHWVFAALPLRPIWIIGKAYDVFASAADLLDDWAAKLVLAYDFEVGQQHFSRSQQAKALRDQAQRYRAQSRPRHAPMVRDDVSAAASVLGAPSPYGTAAVPSPWGGGNVTGPAGG